MSLSEKVIVTDVDGVLLDWLYSFTNWMKKHGFEVVEGGEDSYDVSIRYGLGKVEKDRLLVTIFLACNSSIVLCVIMMLLRKRQIGC